MDRQSFDYLNKNRSHSTKARAFIISAHSTINQAFFCTNVSCHSEGEPLVFKFNGSCIRKKAWNVWSHATEPQRLLWLSLKLVNNVHKSNLISTQKQRVVVFRKIARLSASSPQALKDGCDHARWHPSSGKVNCKLRTHSGTPLLSSRSGNTTSGEKGHRSCVLLADSPSCFMFICSSVLTCSQTSGRLQKF